MPRFVRNFWLQGRIDGRQSEIETGPRSADGGFILNVFQRDQGEVAQVLHVEGTPSFDGKRLRLVVFDGKSNLLFRHETER